MTERRQQFARVVATLVGCAALQIAGTAWGQGAVRDQSGTLTAAPTDQQKKSWLEQRFAGSFVELDAYIGSGSFYSSGYRDPYVSNALYLRPTYQLGTKYKLTLNARVYLEEEYTMPDNPTGRRLNPLDTWVYLSAKNLYTMPRAKVTFSGTVRAVAPTSYESRYAHLVTSLGASGVASRPFEFGRPNAQGKRWDLVLSFASGFSKALRTSAIRGNFPGDSTGCRTTGPAGFTGGAGAADTDRCGGPLSTSYSFTNSLTTALAHGRYSLSGTLIVINEFRYTVDPTTWTGPTSMLNTVPTGRSDWTWGLVALGYDVSDHFAVQAGLASFQPALDSRYQNLRFPFFDFSGGNANNFTQVFLGVTGTL